MNVANNTIYHNTTHPSYIALPTVHVDLLTDLNLDGKVDMRDISAVAMAFGAYPGHSRWSASADINRDNRIDMRDISRIARNFGKTI